MRIIGIASLLIVASTLATNAPVAAQSNELLETSSTTQIARGTLVFPQSVGNSRLQSVVYQELEYTSNDRGVIYLSASINQGGGVWQNYRRFSTPASFSLDTPPLLFSAAVTDDGELLVAFLADVRTVSIYRYISGDAAPRLVAEIATETTTVAPNLFLREDGGVICFLSSGEADSDRQSIYFTVSSNFTDWSRLRAIAQPPGDHASFLPAYTIIGNREIVVFQSLIPDQSSVYQLFVTSSDSGGSSWTRPRPLTQFRLPDEQQQTSTYDNQRPTIVTDRDRVLLSWERRARGENKRIVYAELNARGDFTSDPVAVTILDENASQSQLLVRNQTPLISWSGGQGRSRFVAISTPGQSGTWISTRIGRGRTEGFASLAELTKDSVRVSWLEIRDERSGGPIYTQTLSFPSSELILQGGSFATGRPANDQLAVIEWRQRGSTQQLDGFRYSWSLAAPTPPTGDIELSATQQSIQLFAEREGDWHFTLQARDRFGNWLEPQTLRYRYDITPPTAVRIQDLELDSAGFVPSNSFNIAWSADDDNDIAGYYVDFRRIGVADQPLQQTRDTPPLTSPTLNYRDNSVQNLNIENGLWQLRIAAIDTAGNSGPAIQRAYRLNKYIPVTLIYSVSSSAGERGEVSLAVEGRGFLEQGRVEECILDIDAASPYDYRFTVADGDCRVLTDSDIDGIPLTRVRGGNYFVGLAHSQRGLTFSAAPFELLPSGAVLFGQFETPYTPQISTAGILLTTNNRSRIALLAIITLLIILLIFLFTRLLNTIRESVSWRKELAQLDQRDDNRYTKEERMAEAKRLRSRGISLRIKFTVFIILLVITIVLLLSVILGSRSLSREERILATSLQERVAVLLDSISTQAGNIFLNSENLILDLEPLVNQLSVLDEAEYITITGAMRGNEDVYGAVWATNDSHILEFNRANDEGNGVLSLSTEQFSASQSVLQDAISDQELENVDELNQRVAALVGDTPQRIADTNQEVVRLITESVGGNTALDTQRLQELDDQLNDLTAELIATIREQQSTVRSFPAYDSHRLDQAQSSYIFHQPIIAWSADRVGTSGRFYRGTVRIGISTELLLEQLEADQREVIFTTLLIAAIASVIGIIGASLLAAIVVAPIKRVVRGVEVISETEDKSDLREHIINVRTKDELGILAQSVNQMTRGLVKASDANKELIVGKEIQKLFIPLIKDKQGNKISFAEDKYDGIDIAGYYEGAHGVSGDYFSYTQLDEQHFAIIKCDVSGKGIPAALIMVEVATIFSDFTRDGTSYRAPNALSVLTARINDLLESMQFRGRFAALTIAIINQQSGKVRVTHAGDKQIHLYRHATKHVEVVNLPETPAAGVFSSDMLPNGFSEHALALAPNDALLLFTDGIDESRRVIRNTKFVS